MQITQYANGFQAPSGFDPADFSRQMQRIGNDIDAVFDDLSYWSAFTDYAGGGEVGTPAIYKSTTVAQTGFQPSVEKAITWNSVEIDNTGTQAGTGELFLPDQNQRYWWWMGVNLLMPAITVNARYTTRLYVQDRDPSSGQLLTGVYRYNQYMIATGDQYMMFDGFFRTGGGRMRVTMSHGNNAAINVLAGSSVWAVRICPDR